MQLNEALDLVTVEHGRACRRFPLGYHSTHEGYGVLAEEVAELLDAIRANDIRSCRDEAVQVAAVAVRFLVELCASPTDEI